MDSRAGFVFLAAFSIAIASKDGFPHWGYKESDYGPGDWGKVAPPCSGQLQSPINIVSSLAEVNTTHNDLVVNFDNMDGTVTGFLINNGHAPKVIVDNNQGGATVTGGPLGQNMFILQQFHFHFGCNSSAGSEHTLDGKTFASEMHLVFYNSVYKSFQVASSKPDGLAVIGVFLQVDGGFSKWMEYIAVSLRNIKTANEVNYNLGDSIALSKLVPELASKNAPYYAYKGSLTTPPCYESVQWIVMKNPISVTESQLEMMRLLTTPNGTPMCNNFRPVRPLNGRKLIKWSPKQAKLPGRLRFQGIRLYH